VKRRRKHGSKRTKGHRQQLTLLRVTEILASGGDSSGVKSAVGAGSAPAGAKSEETTSAKAKSAKAAQAPKAEQNAIASEGDDLKKLSGVGPALEKKLRDAGVMTFAQIAAWTEEDVADMDEKLSFKGRIQREGWVEQAQELVKG
jgi:large subunit ribosomal protein L21